MVIGIEVPGDNVGILEFVTGLVVDRFEAVLGLLLETLENDRLEILGNPVVLGAEGTRFLAQNLAQGVPRVLPLEGRPERKGLEEVLLELVAKEETP